MGFKRHLPCQLNDLDSNDKVENAEYLQINA